MLTNQEFFQQLADLHALFKAGSISETAFKTQFFDLWSEWSEAGTVDLLNRLSSFQAGQQTFLVQYRNWLAGTPTGGPNSDGYYPLTSDLGVTIMAPCIALLTSTVTGPAANAVAAAASVLAATNTANTILIGANNASNAAIAANTGAQSALSQTIAARNVATNAANTSTAISNSLANAVADLDQAVADVESLAVSIPVANAAVQSALVQIVAANAAVQGARVDVLTANTATHEVLANVTAQNISITSTVTNGNATLTATRDGAITLINSTRQTATNTINSTTTAATASANSAISVTLASAQSTLNGNTTAAVGQVNSARDTALGQIGSNVTVAAGHATTAGNHAANALAYRNTTQTANTAVHNALATIQGLTNQNQQATNITNAALIEIDADLTASNAHRANVTAQAGLVANNTALTLQYRNEAEEFRNQAGEIVGGDFQPNSAVLTDLSTRTIGADMATSIIDRQTGDVRYAATDHDHANFLRVITEGNATRFNPNTTVELPMSVYSPMFSVGETSNYLLRSEEFDNSSWVKTGITISTNHMAAPHGDLTAERLTGSTATSNAVQTVSQATLGAWTFSLWVRADAPTTVNLKLDSNTQPFAGEDLEIGPVWKRVWITRNFTIAHTQKIVTLTVGNQVVWTGGAQLDISDRLRGYRPTTTGSVSLTRAAYFRNTMTADVSGSFSGNFSGSSNTPNGVNSYAATITLNNGTQASASAQTKNTPSIRFVPYAWDSTASASRQHEFWMETIAIPGAGNATSKFQIRALPLGNAALASTVLELGQDGIMRTGRSFSVNAVTGTAQDIHFETSGLDRWTLRSDATAESGSDAGSNFSLIPFTDAGAAKTPIFTAYRSNSVLDFAVTPKVNGNTIFTTANDGAGSGLDADLLDGQQGSFYLDAANLTGTVADARLPVSIANKTFVGNSVHVSNTNTSWFIFSRTGNTNGIAGEFTRIGVDDARTQFYTQNDEANVGIRFRMVATDMESPGTGLNASEGTIEFVNAANATSITVDGFKVWTQGNDGAGSGLDADLLDGNQGSYFTNATNLFSGTVPSARLPASIDQNISFGANAVFNGPLSEFNSTLTKYNGPVEFNSTLVKFNNPAEFNGTTAFNGSPSFNSNVAFSFLTTHNDGVVVNSTKGLTVNGPASFTGNTTVMGWVRPSANATQDIGASNARFANVYATNFQGQATSALYADLAERFEASVPMTPGQIVTTGGEKEITTAVAGDHILGVISTNPAFRMNDGAGDDTTHPFVAYTGRVPCLVRGRATKHQIIVTTNEPGVGRAVDRHGALVGQVVGYALADKTSDDLGVVEIVIR